MRENPPRPSPSTREDALYLLALLAIALWFVLPVFAEPSAWGSTRDWGYFTFLEEVTRKTVIEFHQFPLWNPYYFGGAEHLANPQTTVLSPTTLLTLVFGTALGLKLGVLLFALLGVAGMYALARHLGCSSAGAAMSALIYGCSGWFAQHVGGGHWGFAAVNLFPFTAFFFLRAEKRPWSFVAAVMFGAWISVHWGVYPLPWLLMLMLVFSAGESIRRRNAGALVRYAMFVLFTVSVSAVRVLPVFEFVQRFPRGVTISDRLSPGELLEVFTTRHAERLVDGHPFVWPEYGNYVGWVPLVLLGCGLIVRFPRKWLLWSAALVFVALALGDWGSFAPYALLHGLPIMENLRVPSRYTIVAIFFLAPIAGLAFTSVADRIGGRHRIGHRIGGALARVLGIALLAGITLDAVSLNRTEFEQAFHLAPPTDDVSAEFVQKRGDPARMYAYPRANQGSVDGLEESPVPRSPVIGIELEREFVLLGESGTVEQTSWSPNALGFVVDTQGDNLLVINQNYRPDWRVDGLGSVVQEQGLLAVALPPGRHAVYLRYGPSSYRIGLLVSLVAITILVVRARRKTGAA